MKLQVECLFLSLKGHSFYEGAEGKLAEGYLCWKEFWVKNLVFASLYQELLDLQHL